MASLCTRIAYHTKPNETLSDHNLIGSCSSRSNDVLLFVIFVFVSDFCFSPSVSFWRSNINSHDDYNVTHVHYTNWRWIIVIIIDINSINNIYCYCYYFSALTSDKMTLKPPHLSVFSSLLCQHRLTRHPFKCMVEKLRDVHCFNVDHYNLCGWGVYNLVFNVNAFCERFVCVYNWIYLLNTGAVVNERMMLSNQHKSIHMEKPIISDLPL